MSPDRIDPEAAGETPDHRPAPEIDKEIGELLERLNALQREKAAANGAEPPGTPDGLVAAEYVHPPHAFEE